MWYWISSKEESSGRVSNSLRTASLAVSLSVSGAASSLVVAWKAGGAGEDWSLGIGVHGKHAPGGVGERSRGRGSGAQRSEAAPVVGGFDRHSGESRGSSAEAGF